MKHGGMDIALEELWRSGRGRLMLSDEARREYDRVHADRECEHRWVTEVRIDEHGHFTLSGRMGAMLCDEHTTPYLSGTEVYCRDCGKYGYEVRP